MIKIRRSICWRGQPALIKLPHSPGLVAVRLSVRYETWVQLAGITRLWLVRLNIRWVCRSLQWIEGWCDQWEFPPFCRGHRLCPCTAHMPAQIEQFMGPTWGPPGSCRPQMGPMLVPWTLLLGKQFTYRYVCVRKLWKSPVTHSSTEGGWSCYVTIQYALEQTYDMQHLLRMIVALWNDLPHS